jgi:hypothetical protein
MNIYTHQVVSSSRKGGNKKKYRQDFELAEMQKQERKGRYREEEDDDDEDEDEEEQ